METRNELCWCGSGLKYKKCHLQQDRKLEEMAACGYPVPSRDIIRSDEDIEGIKAACQLSKYILDAISENVKTGVKTEYLDQMVYELSIAHKGYPAPLNYRGFPKSCCISVNQVVCHGIPGAWTLKEGDIVNVDITTILNGYYGDISRMFMVGQVSEAAQNLVKTAEECMFKGIEEVKPYNRIGDIAYAIERHAVQHGYSVVQDYGGHGIGKAFHEEPFVFHFGAKDSGMVLAPNMVFTIEPMINAGNFKCKLLEDKWTAVTADGSLSAQWEHTVWVTKNGVEILTA